MTTDTVSPSPMVNFETDLRAFHGVSAIKAFYLERVSVHEAADEIIRGTYGKKECSKSGWRGCAVGCTIHSERGNYAAYETELGILKALAILEDSLFERMPINKSKTWPRLFLEAIPVGANLSMVVPKFLLWLLVDEKCGLIQYANSDRAINAIRTVANLYRRVLSGEQVEVSEFRAARAANVAYADYAARAAAYAVGAAADAAYAAYAAGAAAYAVGAAGAARAAAYAAYSADAADKLLALLGECTV